MTYKNTRQNYNKRLNYNRFTIARLKAGKVEIAQTSGGKLFHHLVQEGKNELE